MSMTKEAEHIAKGIAEGMKLKEQGTACFKEKRYADALKFYTKIFLYVNGLSAGQYGGMVPGVAKRAEPDNDQAATIKALQLSGNLNCAMCLFRLERYEKMLEFSDRALVVDPNSSKAGFRRGQAMLRLGDLDNAETALQAAQKAFPTDKSVKQELMLLAKKRKAIEMKQRKQFSKMFGNKSKTTTEESKTADIEETKS